MKYIFLFILLQVNIVTFACSCTPFKKIDEIQYKEYNLIVKGKVIKILEDDYHLRRYIYLKVESNYKGKLITKTVKIESPSQSGMCGIFPKIGEKWLVFAYKNGSSYSTNLCTRTKNLNPKAWDYRKEEIAEDLKFLVSKLLE